MEDDIGIGPYSYQPGFFEEFYDWLDGAAWRRNLFTGIAITLLATVAFAGFAVTIYCGYWLGLGGAFGFKSFTAFEQGIPLLTDADLWAHIIITFPVWCVLTHYQITHHPVDEVMEGGMLVYRSDWPNHSLWFYLIFALILPTIAGFIVAVW